MKSVFSIVFFLAAVFSVTAGASRLAEIPGDNEETRAATLKADSDTMAQFCPKCLEEIAEGQHGSISPEDRYQIVNAAGGDGGSSGDQGTN